MGVGALALPLLLAYTIFILKSISFLFLIFHLQPCLYCLFILFVYSYICSLCECNANGNGTQSTTVNPNRNANTTPMMFGAGGASASNTPVTSCSCGNLMNPNGGSGGGSSNANAFNININNGAYNDGSAANSADTLLSSNAKFQAISAIAVSQDGVINVADQGMCSTIILDYIFTIHMSIYLRICDYFFVFLHWSQWRSKFE